MAVKIDGIVHATVWNQTLTRCGLSFDQGERYRDSRTTCEKCRTAHSVTFVEGWAKWDTNHPSERDER